MRPHPAGIALLSLLTAGPAVAMQAASTPVERCQLATLVLAGEATSHEVRWTEGPEGGLETTWWFTVDLVFKGSIEALGPYGTGALELTLAGGDLGELGQWVEDQPVLEEDARYLLLLQQDADGGWVPVGGEAGAVRLRDRAQPAAPTLTEALRFHGGCRG